MFQDLTRANFKADETGIYWAPNVEFAIEDNLHAYYEACRLSGEDAGKPLDSLVLLCLDEQGGIATDGGLFHSWDDVLRILNYHRLQNAYAAAAVLVYDEPSESEAQRATNKAAYDALRAELDRRTPLGQFVS
jgi:hypothetical protein